MYVIPVRTCVKRRIMFTCAYRYCVHAWRTQQMYAIPVRARVNTLLLYGQRTGVVCADLLLHALEQHCEVEEFEIILSDIVLRSQQGLMNTVGGQVTKLLQLQRKTFIHSFVHLFIHSFIR